MRVLAGTWNVNQKQPTRASLHSWLGARAQQAELVCVGIQVRRDDVVLSACVLVVFVGI